MPQIQIKHTPLETLVMAQLAAIRRHEAALQSRLSSSSRIGGAENIATELSKLQISADRLNRMIDAMG